MYIFAYVPPLEGFMQGFMQGSMQTTALQLRLLHADKIGTKEQWIQAKKACLLVFEKVSQEYRVREIRHHVSIQFPIHLSGVELVWQDSYASPVKRWKCAIQAQLISLEGIAYFDNFIREDNKELFDLIQRAATTGLLSLPSTTPPKPVAIVSPHSKALERAHLTRAFEDSLKEGELDENDMHRLLTKDNATVFKARLLAAIRYYYTTFPNECKEICSKAHLTIEKVELLKEQAAMLSEEALSRLETCFWDIYARVKDLKPASNVDNSGAEEEIFSFS